MDRQLLAVDQRVTALCQEVSSLAHACWEMVKHLQAHAARIEALEPGRTHVVDCETCFGYGDVGEDTCPSCSGKGCYVG